MNQETQLLVARLRGFAYELGALIATALVGFMLDFLGSDVFRELVTKHFGETILASLVFLIVSGVTKHLRNLQVLGTWNRFGSVSGGERPDLI